MKPKVEAVIQFVKHTGKRAVITSIAEIEHSVAGTAGTQFV
jgi:carbamate kinase